MKVLCLLTIANVALASLQEACEDSTNFDVLLLQTDPTNFDVSLLQTELAVETSKINATQNSDVHTTSFAKKKMHNGHSFSSLSLNLADVMYAGGCFCLVFVIPWVLAAVMGPDENNYKEGLPYQMPALTTLRYFAVLWIWINHEWLCIGQSSQMFAVLSGYLLNYVEERKGQTAPFWKAYADFLSRRVVKLYPLFALHVVVGYVADFRSNCQALPYLFVLPCVFNECDTCGTGTWFIPVIIGCYVVFPVFSPVIRKLGVGAISMLVCLSVALISSQSATTIPRMVLWIYLPYFFIGVLISRAYVIMGTASAYERFCQLACHLGPLGLFVVRLVNGESETAETNALYILVQMIMILGFAGPRSKGNGYCNPALNLMSWEPFGWLAEFTLPLYMTNTIACRFVDKNLVMYGMPGLQLRTRDFLPRVTILRIGEILTLPMLCCFVLELIFMHAMAWAFHKTCTFGATGARSQPSGVKTVGGDVSSNNSPDS